METILEFLFEFILVFPGAFFRWLLNGCRRKYTDYLDSPPGVNTLSAIIGFAVLYFLLRYLFSLF